MNALRLLPFLLFVFNAPLFCQDFNLGVLDLNDGDDEIKNLTSALGKLFFVKNGELWVSDGLASNTQNLGVNALGLLPNMDIPNGRQLFVDENFFLYSTDGTIEGTESLSDSIVFPLHQFSERDILDGYLYLFVKGSESNQYHLMKTDGTANGSEILLTMGEEGIPYIGDQTMTLEILNDEIYFLGRSNDDTFWGDKPQTELWKTDGTIAGTTLIADLDISNSIIEEGVDSIQNFLLNLRAFNDHLMFTYQTFRFSDSLGFMSSMDTWISNGTYEGTTYLFDEIISYDITPFGDDNFLFTGGKGFLIITDAISGDYTILNPTFDTLNVNTYEHIILEDKVLFNQFASVDEYMGLWSSDGTVEGTVSLMSILDYPNFLPNSFRSLGDKVFFRCCYENESFEFWFTDGTVANTYSIGRFDSTFKKSSEYTLFQNRLYFLAENHELGKTIHYLELEPNSNIIGRAFHDLNENSIWEDGEPGIPNLPIVADEGQATITYTQEDGTYRFSIFDSTTYQIRYLDQNHCWVPTTSPAYYEIQLGDSVYQDLNFGFRSLQGAETAYLDVQSGPTRCGFTVPFWVNLHNTGCLPIEGEVHIQLDEMLTLVSYDEDELTVNGQQLIWSFDSITASINQQLHFELEMPGTEALGDTIFLEATAYITHQDSLIDVGTYLYESVITCAYDPNDKLVRPSRPEESNSNYTQIDETLFYTIRFQNTGNDTAFTIRILDQLAPELDWETFQPLSASHDYKATLFPDGEVEFLFEDILLPDSIVNEPGSHGYVAFSIALKGGLEDFTEVENTARIYFDYNEPIITNTTTNTIVEYLDLDEDGFYFWEDCDDENPEINPLAEEIPGNDIDEDCNGEIDPLSVDDITTDKIQLFPNPATNTLQLVSPAALSRIELLDAFGRTILTEQASLAKSYEIDITFLSQGVYFIRAYDSNQNLIGVEKVIKR